MEEGEGLGAAGGDAADSSDEARGGAARGETAREVDFVAFADLKDGAEFFGEEGGDYGARGGAGGEGVEHDF